MKNKNKNFIAKLTTATQKYKIEPFSLFLYTIIFYLTFLMTMAWINRGGDFPVHINLTLEYYRTSQPLHIFTRLQYPLWHIMVGFIDGFFNNINYSAAFVTAFFNLLTTIIMHYYLKRFLNNRFNIKYICLITFMLSFVMAIWLPWFSPNIYFGPASPTLWHNPTSNAVKGISILIFFMFVDTYIKHGINRMTIGRMMMFTFLFFISVLLKPSFIILFIPSAFIFLIIDLIRTRGKSIIFCLQIAIACIPSLIPLAFQYTTSYTNNRGGVVFSFLTVISGRTSNIPLTLLLPYIFPVLVLMISPKNIYKNKMIFFALIMSVIGTAYHLCFVEAFDSGTNELSWCRVLAMSIMWIVATIEFFIYYSDSNKININIWKKIIVSTGFIALYMHFITGLYYFIVNGVFSFLGLWVR